MKRRHSIPLVSLTAVSALLVAGCGTTDPNDPLANYGPVRRGEEPIRFVSIGPTADIPQLVAVAKTLRKYRRMNLTEQQKLQRLAQAKFDGFVVREVEFIKKQKPYKENVAKIQTRKASRVQKARQAAAASKRAVASRPAPTPEAKAAQQAEIAKITDSQAREEAAAVQEERVAFANLEQAVQVQAIKNQRAQFANFALPYQTPDESNVVAFVSVSPSGNASVKPDLWVIDENPRTLIANVQRGKAPAIRHEGTEVAVVP